MSNNLTGEKVYRIINNNIIECDVIKRKANSMDVEFYYGEDEKRIYFMCNYNKTWFTDIKKAIKFVNEKRAY